MSTTRESTLQSNIIRYLKSKGCVVVKISAGPGVPKGFPDLLALYEGLYLVIEVKATKTSEFQVGQKEMLKKLGEWSYAFCVYGGKNSNWPEARKELDEILR